MRKIIAAINMSLDGIGDHTAGLPDEETHQHYANLIHDADAILYGRITYQLMEYWRTIVDTPTGVRATDEFAVRIDAVPKIVFSRTLKSLDWHSARLAARELNEEVKALKQQTGKAIYVGSPGLISALTNVNLVDEYQICIHPVIAGNGTPLFKQITKAVKLKLLTTKTFTNGHIILYYQPAFQEK